MRQLHFAPPTAKDFLAALAPLWHQPHFAPVLSGTNELAEALAASAEDVPLTRGTPTETPGKTPLIILTEQDGAALQAKLLACLALPAAVILAPVTDWHFAKRPLFLISIPKAGTHLLYELARELGFAPGITRPEFPRGQHWYCVEYENSHTAAPDFFVDSVRRAPFGNRHHPFASSPALFIYRHPLDILVSEAHYYHLDGKTAFAGWFHGLDFSARIQRLLTDDTLLGPFRHRLKNFLPWLDFPNVAKLSFEELVGTAGGGSDAAQHDLIWSLLLKLQAPGDPQAIGQNLFNRDSETFRAGQIGSFRQELPPETIAQFAARNQDILDALGYNTQAAFPAHIARFRAEPLSFSTQNFAKKPLNLESNVLGCNLVRYDGQIYAVPLAAGELHLETLPPETLATLPRAPSVTALKNLLLLGAPELAARVATLNKFGEALRGAASFDDVAPFWQEADNPRLVEAYHGFNILRFRGHFYGIRQTLGAVDLTAELATTLATYAIEDFCVASSVPSLRDEIDEITALHRLKAAHETRFKAITEAATQARAEMSRQLTRLAAALNAAEQQQAALAAQVQACGTSLAAQSAAAAARLAALDQHASAAAKGLAALHQADTALAAQLETLTATTQTSHAMLTTTLETTIAALREDLAAQAATIAALQASWPYRLARRLRRLLGRKP